MDVQSRPGSAMPNEKGGDFLTPDYYRENTGFTHKSADQLMWNSQHGDYLVPGERRLSIGNISKQGTFITLGTRTEAELDSRPSSSVSRPSSAVSKQEILTDMTPRDPMKSRTSFSVPSIE